MSADSAAPIRILSADDHPVLRQGVAALVGGQADMSVVAEASNGREAIHQFRAHHPDVTLMDLQVAARSWRSIKLVSCFGGHYVAGPTGAARVHSSGLLRSADERTLRSFPTHQRRP
jgi:Response regulator receiver domain